MNKNQFQKVQDHILQRFNIIQKLGQGAYGIVYKVQDKYNKKVYALKKIFDAFQHSTDAQRTYREIQVLRQTNHPNIIKLYETFSASNNQDVYILFEYMQSDLYYAISQNNMKDGHFKYITYQIAKSLKYLHSAQIIHRDLKPSNILVNSDCKIKLCDFGLVRSINNIENSKKGNPLLTEKVATRWYRAPQILLGSRKYSTPIDVWSFACIIYEMIQKRPMFPGNSTKDQLMKILHFTGIPSEQDIKSLHIEFCQKIIQQVSPNVMNQRESILKNISPQFKSLLKKMLVFNPEKRITINAILSDPMFKMFRKVSEETVSQGRIETKMDDNKKLTVDQYRRFIYNRIPSQTCLNHKFNKSQADLKSLKKIKSCQSISLLAKKTSIAKKPKIEMGNYEIKKSMDYMSSKVNSPMAKTSNSFMKSANKLIIYNKQKEVDKGALMDKTVADISQLGNTNQIYMVNKKSKHLLSPKQNKMKSQSKEFVWFSPKKTPKNNFIVGTVSPNYSYFKSKVKQQSIKKDYFKYVHDHKNQF